MNENFDHGLVAGVDRWFGAGLIAFWSMAMTRWNPVSQAAAAALLIGSFVAAHSALYVPQKGDSGAPASKEPGLPINEIQWGGNSFGAAPIIVGTRARAALQQGVEYAHRLVALLDDPDSFVTAHVVLTELWRVPEKEQLSIPTSSGYVVVYNGLHVHLDWRQVADKFSQIVVIPDEACQRKRLRQWWADRLRNYPMEFSAKTILPQRDDLSERKGSNSSKPTIADIDWDGQPDVRVQLSINPARKLLHRGVEQAGEMLPLLDDPESFVAAHVVLTELWRVPYKESRWVPISSGYFVHHNHLLIRIEWKEIDGTIRRNITIPDEACQQKRLSEWWKARYRQYPLEFSSKTTLE